MSENDTKMAYSELLQHFLLLKNSHVSKVYLTLINVNYCRDAEKYIPNIARVGE